jgi:uncharacterized membrane-anchored protein
LFIGIILVLMGITVYFTAMAVVIGRSFIFHIE